MSHSNSHLVPILSAVLVMALIGAAIGWVIFMNRDDMEVITDKSGQTRVALDNEGKWFLPYTMKNDEVHLTTNEQKGTVRVTHVISSFGEPRERPADKRYTQNDHLLTIHLGTSRQIDDRTVDLSTNPPSLKDSSVTHQAHEGEEKRFKLDPLGAWYLAYRSHDQGFMPVYQRSNPGQGTATTTVKLYVRLSHSNALVKQYKRCVIINNELTIYLQSPLQTNPGKNQSINTFTVDLSGPKPTLIVPPSHQSGFAPPSSHQPGTMSK